MELVARQVYSLQGQHSCPVAAKLPLQIASRHVQEIQLSEASKRGKPSHPPLLGQAA